jgi:hypothetical protein
VKPGCLRHDVKLSMRYGGIEPPDKPAGVAANWNGSLELTCATAGAEIYYTTDGTFPTPDNGTLYTGAIGPADWGTVTLSSPPGDEALFAAGVPVDGTVLLYVGHPGAADVWSTTGDENAPADDPDWRSYTYYPGEAVLSRFVNAVGAGMFSDASPAAEPDGAMTWVADLGASGQPVITLAAPVDPLPVGTVVRAVAYVTGSVPSDLTTILITELGD